MEFDVPRCVRSPSVRKLVILTAKVKRGHLINTDYVRGVNRTHPQVPEAPQHKLLGKSKAAKLP